MTKTVKSLAMVAMAAALAMSAAAIPVEPGPVPPLGLPWEADLVSFPTPPSKVRVDYMVLGPGHAYGTGAGFLYLYQVENSSAVSMDAFSVTFDTTLPGLLGVGVLPGDDLDLPTALHAPHVAPGEADPFVLAPVMGLLASVDPHTVTWSFAPLHPGQETDTFFIWHMLPPTWGNGVAQNGSPPSPWGSVALGGTRVPVPSRHLPDSGTTVLLLGAALTTLGLVAHKLRK